MVRGLRPAGVYADHFWPYAPPYWRPNSRQGYGKTWWPDGSW
jgi:hypothetical protein